MFVFILPEGRLVCGGGLYAKNVFAVFFFIFWLNRIVVGGDLLHVNYASSKQRTKGSDSLIKEQTTLRAKSKPPSTAANMTAGAERAPRNVKS